MTQCKQPPQPGPVATPREFVDRMQQLKAWSGLTYRQISARALGNGDCLPASTLAGALSKVTLPSQSVVAAFVRACAGSDEVPSWVVARQALAVPDDPPPTPPRQAGHYQELLRTGLVLGTAVCGATAGYLLTRGSLRRTTPSRASAGK
ncbi:hypothetical protein ACFV6E_07740 [Streptomyces sp. NPDC059785]|uniref:hypothetical protein n=1 Tax=unclassified Streptomyces TaxID=2593676 RepID=UPI003652A77F